MSLTWEFEEGEEDDDEEAANDWGFNGVFNDLRTEVEGYFYYFTYEEDDYGGAYSVSEPFEGRLERKQE